MPRWMPSPPRDISMKKSLVGSLILLLGLLWAQNPQREKFRLVHADKLYLSNTATGQILELTGRVNFFYGDTEFSAHRALILDAQKIARLSGNVVVQNDSLHLKADSLAYYRKTEIINLGGRAKITQNRKDAPQRWMQGDHAIYDMEKEQFTAWGRVKAFDEEEHAQIDCGYGFWDRKKGYSFLLEEPEVRVGDPENLRVRADKMELFEEDKSLVASFNVNSYHQDYHVTSDFLIYFDKEEKAVFLGQPRFENDFALAQAQEFHLYFEDGEVSRAVLADSSLVYFAPEEGEEKVNWVKASNIELSFENGKVLDFSADNNVSYYFQQDKDEKKDYFENRAEGQILKAKFDSDNKLQIMDMGGRIKGTYVFENDS